MKRYFKYIFLALIAALMTVSCLEELELETPVIKNDVLTLVPRVQSFANRYVTKAEYSTDEAKISTLAVLVFNEDGTLIHHQENVSVNSNKLTLNRSLLNSPAQEGKLDNATVVLVANIGLADLKNGSQTLLDNIETLTLAGMENYTYSPAQTVITSIGDGFTGFPMIGGTSADLTLASSVNALEVNLKILYAKIIFEIAVTQGTENEGTGMQFALSGCTVHNTANTIPLAIPASKGKQPVDFLGNSVPDSEIATTDGATPSGIGYNTATAGTALGATGTATFSDNSNPNDDQKVKFTFYILESRYNHGSNLKGIYPSDDWLTSIPAEDVKGYNADTDQNKLNGVKYFYDDRIQQYKPKLAGTGKATYVTLKGTYKDYLGTSWNVDYKVYLGKDNAQNFHVDRNSEYTNLITIKGIRNNDDYYDKDENGNKVDQHIWIDHRVNVSYSGNGVNDHVTITRETLLDAHIEVRPLRVKWDNNEFDGVRIYLPTKSDGSLVDWIGIERFTGENNRDKSVYCYAGGVSTGKRKYFTTDLISELQTKKGEYGVRVDEDTNKKYIYLLNKECAWIYFDENVGSTDRPAEINLEFYTTSGSTQNVVYKVKQRGLQTVGGYAIESYEEYLHSYDSADKYNLSTSPVDYTQQGLAWGFPDHKLSQSTIVNATNVPTNLVKNEISKRKYLYDYFHESDGPSFQLFTNVNGAWGDGEFGTGHTFTERASANRDIAVKDMGTIPENAYQYCLSKNKFKVEDGEDVTMTINWYLPDPYEMQAILAAGLSGNSTADLDSDAYYWSSQPSFDRLLDITILNYELSLINETTDNARAVSAQNINDIKDLPRRSQNRIRCVYNPDAKPIDPENMEDRVPDGIGDNYEFFMKAWNGGDHAYFQYMMEYVNTTPSGGTVPYKFKDSDYPYPTFDNNDGKFGFFNNAIAIDENGNEVVVGGFMERPTGREKWGPYTALYYPDGSIIPSSATFYSILTTFPGLSDEELDYDDGLTGRGGARETGKKREDIQIDSTLVKGTLSRTINENSFNNLNDKLRIKFPQSTYNTIYPFPQFEYSAYEKGSQADTTVRYWKVPTYAYNEYTPKPASETETFVATASGTGTGSKYLGDKGKAEAQRNAEKAALAAAKEKAEKKYPNRSYSYGTPSYTYVDKGYTSSWSITTYTMEATCSIEITCTPPSTSIPYYEDARDGGWKVKEGYPHTRYLNGVHTDELRMYCGNSFTISLTDAAIAEGYEITKVKVHYSGNNYVGEEGGLGSIGKDKVYVRFVDSSIKLSEHTLENQPIIGSTETLHLPGMDYSADGETGWHQWTGQDRTSITFILADYTVQSNAGLTYTYLYDTSPLDKSKYIIVNQIDVKCAKKKNATFDFAKIYAENGATSDWTIKHITFTAEGGTEDNPSGATAEGLKLYAGSKVTFKALDGYVINSISGDESLKFTDSRQTVEFPGLPEKTITAPIVVLYSKAATETN